MDVFSKSFALEFSRKLTKHLVLSMSDKLPEVAFAEMLAEIVAGAVCSDWGWNGVCQNDVAFTRACVVWNPQPFTVKHIRLKVA